MSATGWLKPVPDANALAARLAQTLTDTKKRVCIVAGSGVSASTVPGVNAIVDAATESMQGGYDTHRVQEEHLRRFRDELNNHIEPAPRYWYAAESLRSIRPHGFDVVVQQCILRAYSGPEVESSMRDPRNWVDPDHLNDACRRAEHDLANWTVPTGIQDLAHLIKEGNWQDRFSIATTNFDPMIEISLRKLGLVATSVDLSDGGHLGSIQGAGISVAHLHGYWTTPSGVPRRPLLHTPDDLDTSRIALAKSLTDAMRSDVVLFLGYSGWRDIVTQSIKEIHTQNSVEFLWAQYSADDGAAREARESIGKDLTHGDRDINVYSGVDSNSLFNTVRQLTLRRNAPTPKRRPKFAPLGSPDVTTAVYGEKAATLSRLCSRRMSVPAGYALFLGSSTSILGEEQNEKITELWSTMTRRHPDTERWIVRSSASVEDTQAAAYAGRFLSTPDVTSLDELRMAIQKGLESAVSPRVSEYRFAVGAPSEPIQMSFVVQHQVDCEYAGVAFLPPPPPYDETPEAQLLVEMTRGNSSALLTGEGGTVFQSFSSGSVAYIHVAGPELDAGIVDSIMDELSVVMQQFRPILSYPSSTQENWMLDVEWAWDGLILHILQARFVKSAAFGPLSEQQSQPASSRPLLDLPDVHLLGSKGAAAALFLSLGIGAKNAELIPPGAPEWQVRKVLKDRPQSKNGTVIRFSLRSEVGVPKRFVAYGGNVLDIFMDVRQEMKERDSSTGIISDFVFVRSSFESYLSHDSLLVEHVPGNWESDSRLPPDLFMWSPEGFKYYRVKSPRTCAIELPAPDGIARSSLAVRAPLEDREAQEWADKMYDTFQALRERLAASLPLNIHFIADEEGVWRFLNIRPTLPVEEWGTVLEETPARLFKHNRYYMINSVQDVDNWDEASRILLTAAPDRRNIGSISMIGQKLLARGAREVFCSFGLLSHPAIVLRELGLTVHPLYGDHEFRLIEGRAWPPRP